MPAEARGLPSPKRSRFGFAQAGGIGGGFAQAGGRLVYVDEASGREREIFLSL
jgi:hypothetical protein